MQQACFEIEKLVIKAPEKRKKSNIYNISKWGSYSIKKSDSHFAFKYLVDI